MRQTLRRAAASSVVIALAAFTALARPAAAPRAAKSAATPKPAAAGDIATVGSLHIPRAQYEARLAAALEGYRQRNGSEVPDALAPIFHREVLEGMIRMDLLMLEAERRGVRGTDAEAEELLQRDPFFNPAGRFDAAKFAAVKAANTPTYQRAIEELRHQVAGQKLQRMMEQERGPSDSLLRGVALRSLAHVTLDFLDVDARRFDGRYREPREREVLEYYRSHAVEFRRGERSVISVIFVDRPAPPESVRAVPAEMKAWDARLRARADSALAALRGGAAFESLGTVFGGLRTNVTVLPGNFPGFWHGSREQSQALFQSKPGTVLPEPVAGSPGYLLVRLDSHVGDHVAPLSEVSLEIRQRLRDDARMHGTEREMTALYARLADSLRAEAVRVRYATADTARMDPGTPSEADLDRFYRGHLADYSSYDAASGGIHSRPLAQVRQDVEVRWRRDRRNEMAQGLAEELERTWRAGRRDPALERSATMFRDIGPLPVRSDFADSGLAAQVLGDSLMLNGGAKRTVLAPYPGGFLVFQVYETIPDYRPTFEQSKGALNAVLAQQQDDRDRAAAKAWFERDPMRWQGGNTLHLSRFIIPIPNALDVPLTRAEVEKYYHEHFDEYSAPEMVHARHILISPTRPGPEADRIARARAESLLAVLRAGADFATVARATSDDPATRPLGGDLGTFGRGAMLKPVERAAFALQTSEISEPVQSTEGYHILQCVEHLPVYAQPFAWVYPNVGYDAARAKAERTVLARGDSVFRHIRTPADAREAARRLGISVEDNVHQMGDLTGAPDVRPYIIQLEKVKPGQLYPGAYYLKAMGCAITWVDSISPPRRPLWQQVETRVLEDYKSGSTDRAVRAKLAELDSLMAAGWSLDSLGAYWGGLQHRQDVPLATGFADLLGGRAVFDSLIFGARGGRPLNRGEISTWQAIPGRFLRVRMDERMDPPASAIAQRLDADRRASLDRAMRPYFDELAKRFSVQILDEELKRTALPPPPPPPAGMP